MASWLMLKAGSYRPLHIIVTPEVPNLIGTPLVVVLGLHERELHWPWLPAAGSVAVCQGRLSPTVGHPSNGLEDWIMVRGREPGPLFWRIRKGDRIEAGSGISGAAVAEILERRRREVVVSPLTPHDWRRSFVGDLWTPAPTWPSCSSWPATPPLPPPLATTDGRTLPSGRRRLCSTSLM